MIATNKGPKFPIIERVKRLLTSGKLPTDMPSNFPILNYLFENNEDGCIPQGILFWKM